jgi:hypothetical protein
LPGAGSRRQEWNRSCSQEPAAQCPRPVGRVGTGADHGPAGRAAGTGAAAKWDLKTIAFAGDVLFREWSADPDTNRAEHQVDIFSVRDGRIRAQAACHTLTPHS